MVLVLMGVAGSGKTTIGMQLAEELGWNFYDADDFHSSTNVDKMSRGIPLNDDDRLPWLESLRDLIGNCLQRGESAVLACSALKHRYRSYLLLDVRVKLVYLKGDYALIEERIKARQAHYMKPGMLQSQFEALEEPEVESHLDISSTPGEIVKEIRGRLGV